MQIMRTATGDLEVSLNLDELSLLGQTLNECCNGFGVTDFESKVGASKQTVVQLLDQIVAMYPATLGGG